MNQNPASILSLKHIFPAKKKAARLISDLANPLILPFLVFTGIGWMVELSGTVLFQLSAIAFVFFTAIPFGITLYLLHKKHISSLDAPEQKTRNKLYGYSIISSVVGSIVLYLLFNHYSFLGFIALVYLINPIIGSIINLKWKISVHTASLAIAGTIIISYSVIETSTGVITPIALSLGLLLLLSLMIWSRSHLQVHTFAELLSGAVVGVALTLLEFSLIF